MGKCFASWFRCKIIVPWSCPSSCPRDQHCPICDNGDILRQEFFISIIVIIIKWLLCIVSFRTAIMGRPNKSNQKSTVFRWSYCLRASVHYLHPRIVWRCDETVCRQQRAAWPGSAVKWTHYFSSDIISIQVCQPALAAAGHVARQPCTIVHFYKTGRLHYFHVQSDISLFNVCALNCECDVLV